MFIRNIGLYEVKNKYGYNLENLLKLMNYGHYYPNPLYEGKNIYKICAEEIERIGIDKNFEQLKDILNTLGIKKSDFIDDYEYEPSDYKIKKEMMFARYDKSMSVDEKMKVINRIHQLDHETDYNELFELIFDEKERSNIDTLTYILQNTTSNISKLLRYVDGEKREELIKRNYRKAYTQGRSLLTPNELNTVIKLIRKTDEIFLTKDRDQYSSGINAYMVLFKCTLLDKLKKVYGKSYTEKTGKTPDSDENEFIYAILSSKSLENIYSKSMFTPDEADNVRFAIIYLEGIGKGVTALKKRDSEIRQKLSIEEKNLYNIIILNKNNTEILSEKLESLGITIDNYGKYVSSRKFLDKKMKKGLITILNAHFKNNNLTISDIITIIREAKDNNMKRSEVLLMKGIDEKAFNKAYAKLKLEQPEIYEILKSSGRLMSEKRKLELFSSIMKDNITNVEDFTKRYKFTPEEVLNMFDNTELFKPLYDKMLIWYDMYSLLPKEDKNKKR